MIRRILASFLFAFVSVALLVMLAGQAYAGGAVARTQQMQQQRMQQQQQIIQQQQIYQMQQQQAAAQQAIQARGPQSITVPREEARAVAGLDQVIASLDRSSRDWALIIDPEAKALVVAQYIARFRERGITIGKGPDFYAQVIDAMAEANPQMLAQPFENIVRVVAVIEYDFNNGQNKDEMALKVLGSRQAVLENRKRLGM